MPREPGDNRTRVSPNWEGPEAEESSSDASVSSSEDSPRQRDSTLGIGHGIPGEFKDGVEKFCAVMNVLGVFISVIETVPKVKSFKLNQVSPVECLNIAVSIFFAIEYISRLACTRGPCQYALSFFGLLDGLVALSTIRFLVPDSFEKWVGPPFTSTIRLLRLVRIFRLLRLLRFTREAIFLKKAIKTGLRTMFVWNFFVAITVTIMGSVLYTLEGAKSKGFESIPSSIWWACVTITTVGYGDTVPLTPQGRLCGAGIMLMGYSLLAVPTIIGLVGSSEIRKKVLAKEGDNFKEGSMWASHPATWSARVSAQAEAEPQRRAPLPLAEPPGPDSLEEACWRSEYMYTVRLHTAAEGSDQHGHVSCAAVQALMDRAVCTFLAHEAGWLPNTLDTVVESSCQLLAPLSFPEGVDAGLTMESVAGPSCVFRVGLFREGCGTPCAIGRIARAWANPASKRPQEVPDSVRESCERIARTAC